MHEKLIEFYNAHHRKLWKSEDEFIWKIITKLDEEEKVTKGQLQKAQAIMDKYS